MGPFWKKPETLDISDIEAFPLLDSSARCPKFKFRYTVNVPAGGVTGEAMLLLRVYTLDVNTGELIVVGNGITRLFNENNNDQVRLVYLHISFYWNRYRLGLFVDALIPCLLLTEWQATWKSCMDLRGSNIYSFHGRQVAEISIA